MGPLSKKSVRSFQIKYGLAIDGIAGPNTRAKLNEVYLQRFPTEELPFGIIPQNKNNRTPHHVEKVMNKYRELLDQ